MDGVSVQRPGCARNAGQKALTHIQVTDPSGKGRGAQCKHRPSGG
jgi:hypothetical protein